MYSLHTAAWRVMPMFGYKLQESLPETKPVLTNHGFLHAEQSIVTLVVILIFLGDKNLYIVKCRYNVIQYNIALYTVLRDWDRT